MFLGRISESEREAQAEDQRVKDLSIIGVSAMGLQMFSMILFDHRFFKILLRIPHEIVPDSFIFCISRWIDLRPGKLAPLSGCRWTWRF